MVSQKGKDRPVYEVKSECGTGRGRILHRNVFMPCKALPLEEPAQRSLAGQHPQIQQRKRHKENETKETSEDSESLDEEEHYWAYRLRHHHHQPRKQNVGPPITPEIEGQPELGAEPEEFRMETPVQICVDNSTGHDTQEPTLIVKSADLPRNQEPELSATQPRRSQRERQLRERLTYYCHGTIRTEISKVVKKKRKKAFI